MKLITIILLITFGLFSFGITYVNAGFQPPFESIRSTCGNEYTPNIWDVKSLKCISGCSGIILKHDSAYASKSKKPDYTTSDCSEINECKVITVKIFNPLCSQAIKIRFSDDQEQLDSEIFSPIEGQSQYSNIYTLDGSTVELTIYDANQGHKLKQLAFGVFFLGGISLIIFLVFVHRVVLIIGIIVIFILLIRYFKKRKQNNKKMKI